MRCLLFSTVAIASFVGLLSAQQTRTDALGRPATSGGAQTLESTPTFRAETRLRVHNISVKDKDGNPVEGLTKDDFVITENGVKQEIASSSTSASSTNPHPRVRRRFNPPRL